MRSKKKKRTKKNPSRTPKFGLLAVDPGVELGYAFFPAGKNYPYACGVIKPVVKGADFFVRLHNAVNQFAAVVKEYGPSVVAIEWPSYFGSVAGIASAGHGDLVKLAFTVGKLAMVSEVYGAAFIPVKIAAWKGQLKKPVVINRIRRIIPSNVLRSLKPKSHSWDAIGIGLFMRGLF